MKKRNNIAKLLVIAICALFLGFTLYLSFNLKTGISSDSWYHLRVSQKFSETFGIPQNGPDTYQWRDIEHLPYLYFWINGRILNLNEITLNVNEAILLRVFNVLYSLGSLIGIYLLSKEFFKNKWLRILPMFLLSNTLMFLFLSSSINYDNLGNMFAAFAILFFVRALKNKGSIKEVLMMIIMLCLGTLTKYTVMPLAFILVLLTVFDVIKNWKIWSSSFKGKSLFLLFPLIVLIVLNLGVYGVNFVKFHSLTPDCLDVLTYDQCLENGVFVRDTVWIPPVEVKFFDMVLSGERLDPVRYSGVWVWEMSKRIFGIMGDQSLFASDYILPFYLFFCLVAIWMGVKKWKEIDIKAKLLGIVILFYSLVLMFLDNYMMYLKRGFVSLQLQGRYIFPVIFPLYVLLVLCINKIERKWLRIALFVSLIILFTIGCLPFFFTNVDWSWFGAVEF